jgi:hypothetical protein
MQKRLEREDSVSACRRNGVSGQERKDGVPSGSYEQRGPRDDTPIRRNADMVPYPADLKCEVGNSTISFCSIDAASSISLYASPIR